jgi:hypothetical protein
VRIEKNNDIVLLVPHYETVRSVKDSLKELDIDVQGQLDSGSLEIIDSSEAFFGPASFIEIIKRMEHGAKKSGRSGIVVISDMAAFYHRQMMHELIRHEHSMPARSPDLRYTVFCCYHARDFARLSEDQKQQICENHYNNLFVNET